LPSIGDIYRLQCNSFGNVILDLDDV